MHAPYGPTIALKNRAIVRRTEARVGSARSRGMTLIEVLVVMAIVAILVGGIAIGGGQVASARLRQSATMITGAVRVAFTRANATSRNTRIVFDFDNKKLWLEEADTPFYASTNDKTHTGGADPATATEQAAIAEGDRIIKGPRAPRAHFHIVSTSEDKPESALLTRDLPSGIQFKSVQTAHDDAAVKSGRAYLYFWPGGETERASIQTCIYKKQDDGTVCEDEDIGVFSLIVAPLTGKVAVKSGSVDLDLPVDDQTASDRQDPGAF